MPNPTPASPSKEIWSIQYLRAAAALMVVCHHAANQVPGMSTWAPWQFGTSGVDLFFVISGFIMVVTTARSTMRAPEFWRRRIVRVVPLYWLLTLGMVIVAIGSPGLFKTLKVAPESLIESLLFIPHFSQSFPGRVWPLLVPGWTLNFEMFFYAVFGVTLFLRREHRLPALTAGLVGLVVIGAALGPFDSAAAQTYTHPMLLEFLAGAWIGNEWSAGRIRLSLATSVLMIAVGATLLVLRDEPPFGQLTQVVGAAVVVTGALHERFRAWRSRVLRAIGDSSYSLYLTHIFTLGVLRLLWVRVFAATPTVWQTAGFLTAGVATCALVGWLTFTCIERPLLRRLNGEGARRSTIAAPVH